MLSHQPARCSGTDRAAVPSGLVRTFRGSHLLPTHPTLEVSQGQILANLESISHRCHPILVAFLWELTKETIDLPLSCLQGGLTPLTPTVRPNGEERLILQCAQEHGFASQGGWRAREGKENRPSRTRGGNLPLWGRSLFTGGGGKSCSLGDCGWRGGRYFIPMWLMYTAPGNSGISGSE